MFPSVFNPCSLLEFYHNRPSQVDVPIMQLLETVQWAGFCFCGFGHMNCITQSHSC